MDTSKTWVRIIAAAMLTFGIVMIANYVLGRIDAAWTAASMRQVSEGMSGDQVDIRNQMFQLEMANWATWIISAVLIGIAWFAAIGRRLMYAGMTALALLSITACTVSDTVIVTPPNYVVVVDLSDRENQAQGNSFENGELLQVSQVTVRQVKCSLDSRDFCPDKLVAEIPGAPEARIFTTDPNTGTSTTNQALCFSATGSIGCLDFSVNAVVQQEDAKCYANKMGTDPITEADGTVSRFHYKATPLELALDNRVIQIASSVFAENVTTVSPLDMETRKFEIFDQVRPQIIKTVHEQTCITLLDLSINAGVDWKSDEVQAVIDQATVSLAQAEIDRIQVESITAQMQALEQVFGRETALRLMEIKKWNGNGSPYVPLPTLQPIQEQPAPQPAP